MQITESLFTRVQHDISKGATTKQLSNKYNLSDRAITRIREAGTWRRWPYITAKAQHGYMTPEYKAYLKRRKLPLIAPPKPSQVTVGRIGKNKYGIQITKPGKKPNVWQRFIAWIRSFS